MNILPFSLPRIARNSRHLLAFSSRSLRQSQFSNFKRAYSLPHQMASAAVSSLADQLKTLDLGTPLSTFPNCYPDVNPVDIYRAHLTTLLTQVTGVEASIVYPALQWTQTLDMGDLVLPVAALRVKGKKKPAELAEEWVANVPLSPSSSKYLG